MKDLVSLNLSSVEFAEDGAVAIFHGVKNSESL
jgi:hypothetical protein